MIEFGVGIGFVGIVVSLFGGNVIIIDWKMVLNIIRMNVEGNLGKN